MHCGTCNHISVAAARAICALESFIGQHNRHGGRQVVSNEDNNLVVERIGAVQRVFGESSWVVSHVDMVFISFDLKECHSGALSGETENGSSNLRVGGGAGGTDRVQERKVVGVVVLPVTRLTEIVIDKSGGHGRFQAAWLALTF